MATLQEAVTWVKDALGRRKVVEMMTFYCFRQGYVMATNGYMTAGYPVDFPDERLVAGEELESALTALGGEVKPTVGEDSVVLRAGRAKATVQALPWSEAWPGRGPEKQWRKAPEALAPALGRVAPFIHDNATIPWQSGVALYADAAWSTNGVAIARAPIEGLRIDDGKQVILPPDAAEFVRARADGLRQWQTSEEHAAFIWQTGAWMRTILVRDRMPDQVSTIIAGAGDPSFQITDELRKSLKRVLGVAETGIKMFKDRIEGGRKAITLVDEAEVPVPTDSDYTAWAVKHLEPVLEVATHMQFDKWPAPSPWKGQGVSGVLVGLRY